jgi:NADPH:quinone reductase-like Zn-dependent oxidoreductase
MKTVNYTSYGSPQVLTIEEKDRPEVGKKDLLIQVHTSLVTQGDRRLRSADFPALTWLPGRLLTGLFRPKNPTPGTVFAGRVVEVGSEVTSFSKGDEVYGNSMYGAYAEYMTVPESGTIARMPAGVGYEAAVALPYGALTALVFLKNLGNIRPKQRVLIVGAAGGVGRYAVQLACHFGAEVTAVCRGNNQLVRSLGAHHVIDSETIDFTKDNATYDIIFDTSGTYKYKDCEQALTANGRFLSLYLSLNLLFHMVLTTLFGKRKAIAGVALGTRADLDQLRDFAEAGVVRPTIDRIYPLDQIAAAHTRLETIRPHGEIVINVIPTFRSYPSDTAQNLPEGSEFASV